MGVYQLSVLTAMLRCEPDTLRSAHQKPLLLRAWPGLATLCPQLGSVGLIVVLWLLHVDQVALLISAGLSLMSGDFESRRFNS